MWTLHSLSRTPAAPATSTPIRRSQLPFATGNPCRLLPWMSRICPRIYVMWTRARFPPFPMPGIRKIMYCWRKNILWGGLSSLKCPMQFISPVPSGKTRLQAQFQESSWSSLSSWTQGFSPYHSQVWTAHWVFFPLKPISPTSCSPRPHNLLSVQFGWKYLAWYCWWIPLFLKKSYPSCKG